MSRRQQLSHSDVLSTREYEILRLIAAGKSNAQVAQELGISAHTVKNHLSNIFEKLGARSRTQAVVFALGRQLTQSVNDGHLQSPLRTETPAYL